MKKIISKGLDHTEMLSIFREVLLRSGIREKGNLIFAGCQGPCYSMATLLSFGLRDLNLNLYFAADADIQQLWRLEYIKNLGVVATQKENPIHPVRNSNGALNPARINLKRDHAAEQRGIISNGVKAKVLIIMSGLVMVPFEKVLKFVSEALQKGGVIIGETVVPGLFEKKGWDKQIPFKYLFEFSMKHPTSFEVEGN
jgi:hypothetical protein